MTPVERLYRRYAGKWLADTESQEPPRYLEYTDENMAALLSHPCITRPAKASEYPAIREAIDQFREELRLERAVPMAEVA